MKFSLRCLLGLHKDEVKRFYLSDEWVVPFSYIECERCGKNDKKEIDTRIREAILQ